MNRSRFAVNEKVFLKSPLASEPAGPWVVKEVDTGCVPNAYTLNHAPQGAALLTIVADEDELKKER